MTRTCKEIAAQASDRLEGRLGLLARLGFARHLAGCAGCRAYLAQLEATRQALRQLPAPELPASLASALEAQFLAHAGGAPAQASAGAEEDGQASPASPFAPWPLLGTAAALAAVVLSGRPSLAGPDLLVCLWLGGAAVAVAAAARRFGPWHALGGLAASLAAALAAGGSGALVAEEGVQCFGVELAGAAAVAALGWAGARRRGPAAIRREAAASGVAGALAASAGLQLTCGAHLALVHLVLFHVLGVAAAALAAAWAVRGARPAPG
ncbi:MAG: hypothetical protein QM767_02350 [Anaeromyxobacter sp.]